MKSELEERILRIESILELILADERIYYGKGHNGAYRLRQLADELHKDLYSEE